MPRNKKKVIEGRRARIAALYLRGYSQAVIAEKTDVTQQQVSLDLKVLVDQWKQSALQDIAAAKAVELEKINKIESLCWEQFELSKEPKNSTTKIVKSVKITGGNEGEFVEMPGEEVIEKVSVIVPKTGNPRWIEKIQWCIDKRCKILGLDAPFAISVREEYDFSDLSIDELKSLSGLMEKAQKPAFFK